MKFITTINHLSWKQVGIMSATFLLISASIQAQRAMFEATRTVSKASIVSLYPTPYPPHPIPYPLDPPVIYRLEPWFGKPGDSFRVRGHDFGESQGESTLTLNGHAVPILAWSNIAIDGQLPQTQSGQLILTVGNGFSTSMTVSLTSNTLDPQIIFINHIMYIKNLMIPAILTLNQTDIIPLQPAPSQTISTAITNEKLYHAFLQDENGTFLPLSSPPETLLTY